MSSGSLVAEFDRQLTNLIDLGYPLLAGLSLVGFRRRLLPLRDAAAELPAGGANRPFPFVIVVPRTIVTTDDAMTRVRWGDRAGYVGMTGAKPLSEYHPVDGARVPDGPYLALDLDLGDPKDNRICDELLPLLRSRHRLPLLVDEGVALATHHQAVLRSMTGFWLMGERAGDRRVPALWVSRGAPRVGWCWAGTPHDWLGPASCAERLGSGSAGATPPSDHTP